jgi:hypothetical protein
MPRLYKTLARRFCCHVVCPRIKSILTLEGKLFSRIYGQPGYYLRARDAKKQRPRRPSRVFLEYSQSILAALIKSCDALFS